MHTRAIVAIISLFWSLSILAEPFEVTVEIPYSTDGNAVFNGIQFKAMIDVPNSQNLSTAKLLGFRIAYERQRGSMTPSFGPVDRLAVKGFSHALVPYWGNYTSSQNGKPIPALIVELDKETALPVPGSFVSDIRAQNQVLARIVFYLDEKQFTLLENHTDSIDGRAVYLRDFTQRRADNSQALFEKPILAQPLDGEDPIFLLHNSHFTGEERLPEAERIALCQRIAKALGTQPAPKAKPTR